MGYTRISNLRYNISAVCISVPDLSEGDDIVTRIKQELIDKTLRIEKLYHSSLNLYAVELGEAKRVIVTIENTLQYGTVLNIREVLLNHEYDRSSILSPKNTQHLKRLDEELSSTTTTTTTSSTNDNTTIKTISNKSYHKILPFDQDNPIIYDVDQTEIIDSILNIQKSGNSHGRTLLTHGLAGSGKTMVMLEAISQLPSGNYMVMVKSSKLIEDIKKRYDNVYKNPNSDVAVQFESLGSDVSFSDFQHWYNGFYQVNKNQYKLKDQNAAQVYSAMQELALGTKSDNKQIKTIYKGYVQYLSQEEKVDSALKPDSNLCKGKFDDVQGIFIDEVYDFGQVELQNITRHIPQHVNLYCFGDMHQALGGDYGGYIQSSMKKALHRQGLSEATEYDLIGSYRNSVVIKKLVANILDQARLVGKDDKDTSDIILRDNNELDLQAGTSGYHFASIKNKKTIDNVQKSIKTGSNIAIIVDNNASKRFAQKKLKLSNQEVQNHIYTVEESKGLEFDHVVLMNYFTDNVLDMNEFFKPSKHNKQLSSSHSLPLCVSKLYVAIARAKTALTIIEDQKYFNRFEEYKPVISRGITDKGTVDVLAFDVDSTVNLIRQFIDRSDFDKAAYRLDKLKQYIDRYATNKDNRDAMAGIEDIEMIQVQYESLGDLLAQEREQHAQCQETQHIAGSKHVQQNLTKTTPTDKIKTPSGTVSHNSSSSKTHVSNQVNNDIAEQCEDFVKTCRELDQDMKINSQREKLSNFFKQYETNFDCVMKFLQQKSRDDFFKWKGNDGKSIIDVLIETDTMKRLEFEDLGNNHAFANHLAQYMELNKDDEYIKSLYKILPPNFISKTRFSLSGSNLINSIVSTKSNPVLEKKKITPEKLLDHIKAFDEWLKETDAQFAKSGKFKQNYVDAKQNEFLEKGQEYFNSLENKDFQDKYDGIGIIAHIINSNKTEIIVSASNFPNTAINHILYFMAYGKAHALVGIFNNECFLNKLSQKHLLKCYKDSSAILTKLLSNEAVYEYLDKILEKLQFDDPKVISIFKQGSDADGDNTLAFKRVINALKFEQTNSLEKLVKLIEPKDHYKILKEYADTYYQKVPSDYKVKILKLQKAGVNINAVDSDRNNILHYLAKNKKLDVSDYSFEKLLSAGLNFCAQNKKGSTPMLIAQENNNKNLLKLFTHSEYTKKEIIKDPCIWSYIYNLSAYITTEGNKALLETLFDNNRSEVSHLMLDTTSFPMPILSILVKNGYFSKGDNLIKINDIVSHLKQGDLFTLSNYVKHTTGQEREYLHKALTNFDDLCAMPTTPHNSDEVKCAGYDTGM